MNVVKYFFFCILESTSIKTSNRQYQCNISVSFFDESVENLQIFFYWSLWQNKSCNKTTALVYFLKLESIHNWTLYVTLRSIELHLYKNIKTITPVIKNVKNRRISIPNNGYPIKIKKIEIGSSASKLWKPS